MTMCEVHPVSLRVLISVVWTSFPDHLLLCHFNVHLQDVDEIDFIFIHKSPTSWTPLPWTTIDNTCYVMERRETHMSCINLRFRPEFSISGDRQTTPFRRPYHSRSTSERKCTLPIPNMWPSTGNACDGIHASAHDRVWNLNSVNGRAKFEFQFKRHIHFEFDSSWRWWNIKFMFWVGEWRKQIEFW